MKKAGCVSLVVGVESGSPKILKEISKGISIEQIIEFCKTCVKVGIYVRPYFMFSHIGETFADVKETLSLINKLEEFTGFASLQPTMILPGTALEKIACDQDKLPKDFSWSKPFESSLSKDLGQLPNIPLYIDKLTPDEMKSIFQEYQTRPKLRREQHKAEAHYVANLSLKDLFAKLATAIRTRDAKLKYILSLKFYYEYIKTKLGV